MFKPLRVTLAVAALVVATYAMAAPLGTHPSSYVVQRGDTLWDISAKFLKKPWLWPEIWQANPQVKNPHLIYPGDVLSLAYSDRLTLQPGPRTQAPLNAVPLAEVEPFLKNLRVTDNFEHLPRIIGLENDRMLAVDGHKVYALGLDEAKVGQRFAVVRPNLRYSHTRPGHAGRYTTFKEDLDYRSKRLGSQLLDWERSWTSAAVNHSAGVELLGVELAQVGVASMTRLRVAGDDASTLTLETNGHEVRVGDRLIPLDSQPYDLQFFPHAPRVVQPEGRLQIVAVADALTSGGRRDVVALSGGAREGIDNGTVFSIWRQGSQVTDRLNDPNDSRTTESRTGLRDFQLPDEPVGVVMVFRTFDKVSYGLVMESTQPAKVGYALKHPDIHE